MITQQENQALLAQNADLVTQCTAYKALLTANKLPLSVDLPTLSAAYGRQLFDQLLKVDAGLKARYDLLRTEEGQQKLVADTVNTDGHELLDQLRTAVATLTRLYSYVSFRTGHRLQDTVSLAAFAKSYELNLSRALDAETIDWTGREHVRAYFEQLTPTLNQVRDLFRHLTVNGAGVGETFAALATLYHEDRTDAPVTVNEHRLFEHLLPDLERQDMLGMIPR